MKQIQHFFLILTFFISLFPSSINGFIDDILRQFAQQGGGSGGRRHHYQQRQAEDTFPEDAQEISDKFQWVRGTTWHWNNWRDVTFEPNGIFNVRFFSHPQSLFSLSFFWHNAHATRQAQRRLAQRQLAELAKGLPRADAGRDGRAVAGAELWGAPRPQHLTGHD